MLTANFFLHFYSRHRQFDAKIILTCILCSMILMLQPSMKKNPCRGIFGKIPVFPRSLKFTDAVNVSFFLNKSQNFELIQKTSLLTKRSFF